MRHYNSLQKSCGWPGVAAALEQMVGEKRTEEIFRRAEELSAEYAGKYKDIRGIHGMHVRASYYTAALYYPLKEQLGTEEAKRLLEEGAKEASLQKRRSLEKMPGKLFLALCRLMTGLFFSSRGGFVTRVHVSNGRELRFDILSCPYCTTLQELGCPEVCPVVCVQDEYSYKGMKNCIFERSQTLGSGGDRCDFCYRVPERK